MMKSYKTLTAKIEQKIAKLEQENKELTNGKLILMNHAVIGVLKEMLR